MVGGSRRKVYAMDTFLRIVIGLLLIAHGLVHLLYLTDDVQEFSLDNCQSPRADRSPWS
jgi:hypothetical protein